MSNLMTFEECRTYLNVSERTLRRYVGAKEIPFYKIGRQIRFRREKIDEWLEGKNEKNN